MHLQCLGAGGQRAWLPASRAAGGLGPCSRDFLPVSKHHSLLGVDVSVRVVVAQRLFEAITQRARGQAGYWPWTGLGGAPTPT